MYELTAKKIAEITNGRLITGKPETLVKGYAINSSLVKKGDLFFPLKGSNCDGHSYIKDAAKKGAAGYLYSHGDTYCGAFAVRVDDVLTSLQRLAIYRRNNFKGKVIAITGSIGKTTTKDFIVNILKNKYKLASSKKNFNTEIGLPLTILEFDDDVEVLVLEMGMRGKGQIKLLTDIAKPDIGLITNISKTHIELLGTEENIAQAKAELIEALSTEKQAFLNCEDKWTPFISKKAKCVIKTFGLQSADVKASNIKLDDKAVPSFDLSAKGLTKRVKLNVPGKHNVLNALAAAAVSLELGLNIDDVSIGLSNADITEWRMEIKESKNFTILCDYYNANPQSVESALETLGQMKKGRRKVAILGDMLELGSISHVEHVNVIQKALKTANEVYLIGKNMESAASGLKATEIFHSSEEIAKEIHRYLLPGDVILLKASRKMAFEKIEKAIMEKNASA